MKKEINFLSFPDYLNKFLCANFNQKVNLKNNINFRFEIISSLNVGIAIKAVYLLEFIFPRKAFSFRMKIKKNKIERNKFEKVFYNFDISLTGYEFISFMRFFGFKPFYFYYNILNLENFPLVNRKLKNFDFKLKLKLIPSNLNQSFSYLKNYHLD